MPYPGRLPAFRACLLTLSLVLLSMTAVALTANADPSHSKGLPTHISAKRSCNAGTHKMKHRRATKGKCVPIKSKARSSQPAASGSRSDSGRSPSSGNTEPGFRTPGNNIPVAETPEAEGGPSTPESPGAPGSTPGEKTPTIEPTPAEPVETPPVTEPTEPTKPIETPITEEPVIHEEPVIQPSAPFRFFSSSSFWNEPVDEAPVDPSSAAVMGAFNELIAAEEQPGGGGPWINTTEYSVPVYTVPADQPTVTVTLHDHRPSAALSAAWSAVPLPPNAQAAVGTDGALVVWQPSTDRLWEFWRLVHEPGGWFASWGGAMQNASSNPGVYGPEAWPEATKVWGVSASSLSLVGGLITLEDLEKGQINHALAMSIPYARAGVYASPAQRSDGTSTSPLTLPEGAHLRLDPHLNLASLHLPKLTLMMAEAAQRYGIFVKDHAAEVTFQAQDPVALGTDPYTGPDGYFEGLRPKQLLASFPWSYLELVKMELHPTG
jgi:hypothetical protein